MEKVHFVYLPPLGLNKRIEIPPPIPFTVRFNDQAPSITKLLTEIYGKIRERGFHKFWRRQLVIAFKRNRSLRDILVRAQLRE